MKLTKKKNPNYMSKVVIPKTGTEQKSESFSYRRS